MKVMHDMKSYCNFSALHDAQCKNQQAHRRWLCMLLNFMCYWTSYVSELCVLLNIPCKFERVLYLM